MTYIQVEGGGEDGINRGNEQEGEMETKRKVSRTEQPKPQQQCRASAGQMLCCRNESKEIKTALTRKEHAVFTHVDNDVPKKIKTAYSPAIFPSDLTSDTRESLRYTT